MATKMRQLAGEYLGRGWSVIPVGPDKRPLIAWKEFQVRRATEEEIDEWFKEGSNAQIGIVTGGISDLTVVDVEKDGDTSLFDKYVTYVVKTGGGGYHFYFKYSRGTTNEVRRLPLTDLRSEGGYVVAAGSTSAKGEYEVWVNAPPDEMPEEVLEIFKTKPPQSQPSQPTSIVYEGINEGGRNDALTRYTGKILASMTPELWETVAFPLIVEANKKNQPPLQDYEVRLIFNSIAAREGPKTAERTYGGVRSRPTNQSSSKSNDTVHPEGWTPQPIITLEEAARTQKIDSSKKVATNIGIFDDALLGGFSPGDLIIVAGRSGVGKTTFTQDLSASYLTAGKGVLWFSYEVMAQPLYAKFLEMNLDEENYKKLYVPSPPLTSTLDDVMEICTRAHNEFGVELVAIDHMGFIDADIGRNSNHALAVTQIARALKQMAINNEMTVILPVHVRKVEGQEPVLEDVRDSYGIVQEADAVFLIDRKRSSAQEREKSYYGENVRIVLAKNRSTGVSKAGTFSLVSARYAYQESLSQLDEAPQLTPSERRKQQKDADRKWEEMTAADAR